METIVSALFRRAERDPDSEAVVLLDDDLSKQKVYTTSSLLTAAGRCARLITERTAFGDRVLLAFPPGPEFVEAFLGCLLAGRLAVPVSPPDPRRLASTLEKLAHVAADAQATLGMTSSAWLDATAQFASVHEALSIPFVAPSDDGEPLLEPITGDVAFLQYTSGSTGQPKGVVVTHANLITNQRAITRAMRHGPGQVLVGWLPLFHDMGLVGNLLNPIFAGGASYVLSPLAFLQQPHRWVKAVSRYRAHTSGAPNFAFDLSCRRVSDEEIAALDLTSWEVAYCGAEPVRAETMQRFASRFAAAGFRARSLFPVYGLAEATLLVTAPSPDSGATVRTFDRARLERREVVVASQDTASPCALVGCGAAVDGATVCIVDPDTHRRLPNGQVGEVWIGGPSVAAGYWDRTADPAFTGKLPDVAEPFLRSGDLGFVHDGQLFLHGRLKDTIIIRGRNLYAHDVESIAAMNCPVFRPGCVVAIAVESPAGEGLAVLGELRPDASEVASSFASLRRVLVNDLGVAPVALVGLPPGTIPKTTSGKLQRAACGQMYARGEFAAYLNTEIQHEPRGS